MTGSADTLRPFLLERFAELRERGVGALDEVGAKEVLRELKAVGGDNAKKAEMHAAMAAAKFASPRGPFEFSPSRNPKQNFYTRVLENGKNRMTGIAAEGFADSGKGCKA